MQLGSSSHTPEKLLGGEVLAGGSGQTLTDSESTPLPSCYHFKNSHGVPLPRSLLAGRNPHPTPKHIRV